MHGCCWKPGWYIVPCRNTHVCCRFDTHAFLVAVSWWTWLSWWLPWPSHLFWTYVSLWDRALFVAFPLSLPWNSPFIHTLLLYMTSVGLLCRTSSRAADVEFLQTAFALSTKSEPADRLFLCRQSVDTASCRLTFVLAFCVHVCLCFSAIYQAHSLQARGRKRRPNLGLSCLSSFWAIVFLQRAQFSHCKRCISYSNSVRPSVCPSGCLSVRHTLVLCQNDGT